VKAQDLRKAIRDALGTVDTVIACRRGFDAIHVEPCFIKNASQADEAVVGPLCEQNLAGYLLSRPGKTGVVLKGCDSRTVMQYLQEGLIKRDDFFIIGIPCSGVVSSKKIMQAMGQQVVEKIKVEDEKVIVKTSKGETTLALSDVAPDKCKSCQYPTPLIYDVLLGEPLQPKAASEAVYDDIREIERMSLEERKAYWDREFSKCIRCYACRNACPLCVCRESCIAETREPHWVSQRANLHEKTMFHMIHALHLAGRCTECGECERACPMNIPLGKLKKKINMDMKELFDYEPGTHAEDRPPLYTFKVDEEKIEEHKLS
jgi:formate dehydrogenase (coenzyme F420) beta subunit